MSTILILLTVEVEFELMLGKSLYQHIVIGKPIDYHRYRGWKLKKKKNIEFIEKSVKDNFKLKAKMNEKEKARDPFPIICAAGVQNSFDPINELLENYETSEAAGYLLDKKNADQIPPPEYVYANMPKDSVSELLDIYSQKSKFQMFKENFYEELYYKKKPLAKSCTPKWFVPPKDSEFAFGIASIKDEPVYDLILPKKSWAEISKNSEAAHDWYVLSHNDYYPSEKKDRKYNEKFNSENIFGQKTNMDFSGMNMKSLFTDLKVCPKRSPFINMTQKHYYDRCRFQLGSPLKKQGLNFGEIDDNDIFFGHPKYCDKFGMKELLKDDRDSAINTQEDEFYESFSYLRFIRKKIFHLRAFHINDLIKLFSETDKARTNYLPWNDVFLLSKHLGLVINMKFIEYMSRYYEIVSEDGKQVEYRELAKLLMIRTELPPLKKTKKSVGVVDTTTYREFTNDLSKQSFEECLKPAAGALLSTRPKPIDLRSSIDNLPAETSVRALLSPSMPMYFNLSHRDFLCARSKEEIKQIFEKAQFDLNNFEKIFEEGRKIIPCNEENMCTVEGFRAATEEMKKFEKM